MCVIEIGEFSGYPSYLDIHWIYSVSMVSSAAVQCDRTTVEITYNVCNWNRWIQWRSKLLGDPLNTLSTVSMVNSVAIQGDKTSFDMISSNACAAQSCVAETHLPQWVLCDNCRLWYHFLCEKLTEKPGGPFYCSFCQRVIAENVLSEAN